MRKAIALPFLLGASALSHAALLCDASIQSNGTEVFLDGCINQATADAAIDAINPSIRTLVVRSPGGDAEAAMRLASHLHRNKIDLLVREYCVSSCANYLFLAARHRRASPGGALLAFHGSAFTTLVGLTSNTEPFFFDAAFLSRLRGIEKSEVTFFRNLGVDPDIYRLTGVPSLGKTQVARWRSPGERSPVTCSGLSRPFWLPDTGDLHRFGLDAEGSFNDRSDLPRLLGLAHAAGIGDEEMRASSPPIDHWRCSAHLRRKWWLQ